MTREESIDARKKLIDYFLHAADRAHSRSDWIHEQQFLLIALLQADHRTKFAKQINKRRLNIIRDCSDCDLQLLVESDEFMSRLSHADRKRHFYSLKKLRDKMRKKIK